MSGNSTSNNRPNIQPTDLASVQLRPPLLSSRFYGDVDSSLSELHRLIAKVPNTNKSCCSVVERAETTRMWHKIQRRCESHPHEAVWLDQRGRTCLHAACAKKPPSHVVEALLAACEEGRRRVEDRRRGLWRREDKGKETEENSTSNGTNGDTEATYSLPSSSSAAMWRDKHGRTPLAISVAMSAPLDSVRVLLESDSRSACVADKMGSLPLHLACSSNDDGMVDLVRLLLDAYPKAASEEMNNGRTPLHIAVECEAPVEVVRMLVEVSPDAVAMDRCGATPLVMAIQHNSPVDVFSLLVRANPSVIIKADKSGSLPLLRAIEYQSPPAVVKLLCHSRDTVIRQDRIGNTALHLALQWGTGTYVVRTLLQFAPDASTIRNLGGKTPLEMSCERYVKTVQNTRKNRDRGGHESIEQELQAKTDKVPQKWCNRTRHAWNVVCLLLRAAYYGIVDDKDSLNIDDDPVLSSKQRHWNVLHAAVATGAPVEVLQTAISLKPLEVQVVDDEGRLPLSLALAAPQSGTKKKLAVDWLMDVYPEAAAIPDGDGRYALAVAAEYGAIPSVVLSKLLSTFPEALRIVDPKSGMYPFMMAAVNKGWKNHLSLRGNVWASFGFEENKDLLQLSAVYELLLAGPDLVLP